MEDIQLDCFIEDFWVCYVEYDGRCIPGYFTDNKTFEPLFYHLPYVFSFDSIIINRYVNVGENGMTAYVTLVNAKIVQID
jgi:hypothetical protein